MPTEIAVRFAVLKRENGGMPGGEVFINPAHVECVYREGERNKVCFRSGRIIHIWSKTIGEIVDLLAD